MPLAIRSCYFVIGKRFSENTLYTFFLKTSEFIFTD